MPELNVPTSSPEPTKPDRLKEGAMFAEPGAAAGRSFPTAAVGLAAVSVLVLLVALVTLGRHKASTAGGAPAGPGSAAYAPQVRLGEVEMSESSNLAGGKETYLDGKITNAGTLTVTGVTVEVQFAADSGGAQVESVPVNLIRMRQPEIDTEPVNAEPIAPGRTKEFRLIFDDVKPEWNQQVPAMRVVGVVTR